MNYLVLVVGLGFFVAIAWAVRSHFDSKATPILFLGLIIASVGNIVVFARSLLRGSWGDGLLVAALALMLAAAALFAASISATRAARLKLIFNRAAPHTLIEAGPYRWVRHPFYSSYLLFWFGCALATLHPVNIALFMVIALALVMGAHYEEQGFAKSPLAQQYEAYRRRTGAFWPRLFGVKR